MRRLPPMAEAILCELTDHPAGLAQREVADILGVDRFDPELLDAFTELRRRELIKRKTKRAHLTIWVVR